MTEPLPAFHHYALRITHCLGDKKPMQKRRNDITEGVIWRQVLAFFFPIMLGTLFQQLYNTVDAVVVGRFAGKAALAAVGGSAAQILNLLVSFFVGLSSGATVIVSQYYGAQDGPNVSRSVHTAMWLALTAGAVMTALGLIFAPGLLKLMNTPEDTLGDSTLYMRVIFLSMIPAMIFNVGSGVLRAVGDSRWPLYFLIAACLINVALDLIFVAALNWSVFGVAVATAIAQSVAAILVLFTLIRAKDDTRLTLRGLKPERGFLIRTVQIGLPTGMQTVMYSISNMIITATINGFGTSTVAAWVTLGKVDGLYWMINNAFGVSVMTFAGQNYGAHKLDRAERTMFVCGGLSILAAWLFSGTLMLMAYPIFGIFSREREVLDIAVQMMWRITPFYFLFVPIEMISGALRGMGKTLMPTIITAVGICVFRVIWMFTVVPRWPSIHTITISYGISWLLTSAVFIFYYPRARRRLGFEKWFSKPPKGAKR